MKKKIRKKVTGYVFFAFRFFVVYLLSLSMFFQQFYLLRMNLVYASESDSSENSLIRPFISSSPFPDGYVLPSETPIASDLSTGSEQDVTSPTPTALDLSVGTGQDAASPTPIVIPTPTDTLTLIPTPTALLTPSLTSAPLQASVVTLSGNDIVFDDASVVENKFKTRGKMLRKFQVVEKGNTVLNLKAEESPEFQFSAKSSKFDRFWRRNSKEQTTRVSAKINHVGRGFEINSDLVIDDETQSLTVVPQDQRDFRPGMYRLSLQILTGKELVDISQDFAWGVLALNTNKSVYEKNEEVKLGMAVLDDFGRTKCLTGETDFEKAKLWLVVTSPSGVQTELSTDNGGVFDSGECGVHSVTNEADFQAKFKTEEAGTYQMHLTGENYNGKRSIDDVFYVKNKSDFVIERKSQPTRIYPPADYKNEILISSGEAFSGEVQEFVPISFEISDTSAKVTTDEGNKVKILTWEVNLDPLENKKLSYSFNAPDISPEFYLLGEMRFIKDGLTVFEEGRKWQIAGDATITSTSTGGNWLTGSTWVGSGTPATTDDVVIATTGTNRVLMNGSRTIVSLTINASSILYAGTNPLVLTGNYTNNGTHGGTNNANSTIRILGNTAALSGSGTTTSGIRTWTISGTTPSFAAAASITIGGTVSIGTSVTVTNNGTVTVTTSGGRIVGAGASSTWRQATSSVLNYAGPGATLMATGKLDAVATGNIVNYNLNGAQTCNVTQYYHLQMTNGGAKTCAITANVLGDLTLNGTSSSTSWSPSTNIAINGALNVGVGSTVTTSNNNTFTVSGTTSDSGTIVLTGSNGAKTFTGLIVVNSGGNLSGASTGIIFGAGLVNSGTVAVTGTVTMSTTGGVVTANQATSITALTVDTAATRTFSGSGTIAVTTLTVNSPGTVTNDGIVAVAGAFSGTGGWTQGANSTLNLAGSGADAASITTLTATASLNTVNYNLNGAQTCNITQYYHLKLTGGGAKTCNITSNVLGNVTLNGTSASANWTLASAFTVDGNVEITSGTITTAGNALTITGQTSVNTSHLVISNNTGAKTFTNQIVVGVGGVVTGASTNIIAGSGIVNSGTVAITGTVTMSSAGAVLTANQAMSITGLTVNSSGAVTISGSGTLTAGTVAVISAGAVTNNGTTTISGEFTGSGTWIQGASSTLNLGGATTTAAGITTLTATGTGNTVNYNSSTAAQTVKGAIYHNLTFNKSGQTATLGGSVVTNGNLTITAGTLDTDVANNYAISVAGNWSNSGTFTARQSTVTFTGNSTADQTVTTAAQAFYHLVINNTQATYDNVIFSGNLDIDGNLTVTDGVLDLSVNDPIVYIAGNVSIGVSGSVAKGDLGSGTGDLTTSLVGYWDLDEAQGSSRVDSLGVSTLAESGGTSGQVGQAAGLVSNAALFDNGGTYGHLSVASNSNLTMGDIDFTISAWVYITTKQDMTILSKSVSSRGYSLNYVSSTDRFNFYVRNNANTAGTTIVADTFGAPSLSNWYLVVAWHDSVNDQLGIQINNGTADTTSWTQGVDGSSDDFAISGTDGGTFEGWVGRIDEVGVWKKVLATADKNDLYNAGSGTTYPFAGSGSVWNFNGTSQTITDSSSGQDLGMISIGAATTTTVSTTSNVKISKLTVGANDVFDITSDTLTVTGSGTVVTVNSVGIFTTASSTVVYSGTSPTNIATVSYNNLTINPASAATFTLTGDLTSGTEVNGNLTIGSSATLDATTSNYKIEVKGNWTNNGFFTAQTGRVTFNGTTQTISGSSTSPFYQLYITGSTTRTVTVNNGTYLRVSQNGTLNLAGAASNILTLTSDNTSDWYLQVSGTNTTVSVTYVRPYYSNAAGYKEIDATGGTNVDTSTNTNWNFGSANQAPNSPSSLVQAKTDDTVITTGTWVSTTNIKFSATASDQDASDTISLCVEKDDIDTAFSGTEDSCGTGVAYSGSPVTVTVTISGITDATQYHWRARVKDAANEYSSWVSYGGNSDTTPGADRDFGLDTTAPTGGNVYDGITPTVDVAFNDGSLSAISGNWANVNSNASGLQYYEYSVGTTAGGTGVVNWTNVGVGTSVAVTGLTLQTSQMYYFNVRATDMAGNVSTPISSDGQLIAPSLAFALGGSTITFSNLNPVNSYTNTQQTTLTTSTNAYNGYVVRAYKTDLLRSTIYPSTYISDFAAGSYATPAGWTAGTYGFGYSSSDTSIQGSAKFPDSGDCPGGGTAPCYAPFNSSGPGDIVADHVSTVTGSPISNEQFTLTYKVATSTTQSAGPYTTAVVYTVTPQY